MEPDRKWSNIRSEEPSDVFLFSINLQFSSEPV